MTKARIYRPAKSAMQSGTANTEHWLLELLPEHKAPTDPLMGWVGMDDTLGEVDMQFPTQQEAIEYAKKNHINYEVVMPHPRQHIPKAYADNFRFDRVK